MESRWKRSKAAKKGLCLEAENPRQKRGLAVCVFDEFSRCNSQQRPCIKKLLLAGGAQVWPSCCKQMRVVYRSSHTTLFMHAQYTYTDDDTAAWSARIGANFSGRPQHGLRQWWPPTLHLYHPQPLLLHDLSTFLSLLSSDLSFCRFHAAPSKKGKNMKWSTSISMNSKRTLSLWEINRKYWIYICHCKKIKII